MWRTREAGAAPDEDSRIEPFDETPGDEHEAAAIPMGICKLASEFSWESRSRTSSTLASPIASIAKPAKSNRRLELPDGGMA